MSELTTIQVTKEQLDTLDELSKSDSEVRRTTLQRLIDNYSGQEEMTENRVRELAREEIADRVVREALE